MHYAVVEGESIIWPNVLENELWPIVYLCVITSNLLLFTNGRRLADKQFPIRSDPPIRVAEAWTSRGTADDGRASEWTTQSSLAGSSGERGEEN